MVISVNGYPLALKKGSSFEYISENRLFSGSDAYTLSITFPLRDCPQNLKVFGNIDRLDVSLGNVAFDCEIRDKGFYKFGTLTVVEISGSEVKCQFLEGRSETNFDKTFDKIYINELDLGAPDIVEPSKIKPEDAQSPFSMDNKYVALPWVNNNSDSGQPHNFVVLHEIEGYEYLNYYTWAESTKDLTWQPYLLYIIRKICESQEVGYELDITELEKDVTSRYLLICNTLPGQWDIPEFSRALPHWTVEEFFSKLELFLGGEFTIDHRNKKISFRFKKDILDNTPPVLIDSILEDCSSELDSDDSECDYLESKNLKYKGDDSNAWKFYSCDWFVKERLNHVVRYPTLQELINDNKRFESFTTFGRDSNQNKVLYAEDVNTYYILKTKYTEVIGQSVSGRDIYRYHCYLHPINLFGNRIVNEDENAGEEEIEFLPVPIEFSDETYGFCMFLSVGSYSETRFVDDLPYDCMTGTQAAIMAGSKDKTSEYFDSIYLGWWPGVMRPEAKMPYPIIDPVEVKEDWSGIRKWNSYTMRINDAVSSHSIVHKIDPKIKRSFKFLSDSIPDVRAVFFIHGKRYICEKITATFTETGMSQLLKGEFYPLID